MARILVVEDEPRLARAIADGLRDELHVVDVAFDGREGLVAALSGDHDVVLLDWMLPHASGLDLSRRLREDGVDVPILVLTARDSPTDAATALDAGADDHVRKPFAFEELVARVRALLRRRSEGRSPVLEVGALTLDPARHRTTWEGREVRLTPKEFQLLEALVRRRGAVLSKGSSRGRRGRTTRSPEGRSRSRPDWRPAAGSRCSSPHDREGERTRGAAVLRSAAGFNRRRRFLQSAGGEEMRYLSMALGAVASLGLLALAVVVLGFGVWDAGETLMTVIDGATSENVVSETIKVVDLFLLGLVIFLASAGVYELFISPLPSLPRWARVENLDELKDMLVKATIVVMAISFTGRSVTWTGEGDLMGFGLGTGVVIAALAFFLRVRTVSDEAADEAS